MSLTDIICLNCFRMLLSLARILLLPFSPESKQTEAETRCNQRESLDST